MRSLLAALLILCGFVAPAHAERFESFGDYQVHYNAYPSSFLQPEVARAYGLLRSRVRGVLMVSVLHRGNPVPARVTATATNLANQLKTIELREIREADAIYYLGDFSFREAETLRFRIDVRPLDGTQQFPIGFAQQFFGE